MLVYQLCMLSDISRRLLSAHFNINFLKNIFHVSDWVRVHVYIRQNFKQLKPYQNFGPDLSPDCLLIFLVVLPPVIHDQRD